MLRRPLMILLSLLCLVLFLSGCPKKYIMIPPVDAPPVKDPIAKLLEDFSSAESLQSRISIRIEMMRKGDLVKFSFNGILLYQKPDKFRILGYHPLGMGVFDALYRGGEFFLLSPLENRLYTGEISQFRDLIEETQVRVTTEKNEYNKVPKRIRIELPEKETRVELKLNEMSINSSLPENSFKWVTPKGVEVKPLAQFLKGKKLE